MEEYPKKIYHRDGTVARVMSLADEQRYGAAWAESPDGPFGRGRKDPLPVGAVEEPEEDDGEDDA